jgi:MFS transporter, DHA1 family, tetracycline resistance protein
MKKKPSIPFILITVLIDMIGVGLIIPVLPSLVGHFTTSTESNAYWYGALVFTFGFTQFLCAPLLGALSDRYGRRPVMLLSVGGLGTMFFLSGIVQSLPALLATRLLGGALASNVSVANAYVADITTPENRAKSFGMVGAAFGVGFILGPMIGGLVGGIGLRIPFFVAAGFAILNFLYGLFVLPESLAKEKRRPIDLKKANPFGALKGLVQLKGVGVLVTVIALTNLGQFILHGTWVLFNTFRFGWGPPENGASFFVIGVLATIVQGGLLGFLLRKLGERKVVLLGLTSGLLSFIGYGLATHGWMMYVIMVGSMLIFTVSSTLNAVVSKAAPPHAQGLAMGSLSSLNSVVAVLGPVCGIPLFARVSRLDRAHPLVGAPFFVSATLTAAALYLAWRHLSRGETTGTSSTSSASTSVVTLGEAQSRSIDPQHADP